MDAVTKKVLSATPRNGHSSLTAVAKKAGVEVKVARLHLNALNLCGLVSQDKVKQTGKRGRPQHLFTRVAA